MCDGMCTSLRGAIKLDFSGYVDKECFIIQVLVWI